MTPDEFKQRRKALGWTQTDAARELGVNRRTIAVYEAGVTREGEPAQIPRAIELAMRWLSQERAA